MVKSSGKVVLQTGGRGKSVLPASQRQRPETKCSKWKLSNASAGKHSPKKPKARIYCQNKIYGVGPTGSLCKKHFDQDKIKYENKGKKPPTGFPYRIYTQNELDYLLYKKKLPPHKYDVKRSTKKICTRCKSAHFKEGLCHKHYKSRFLDN